MIVRNFHLKLAAVSLAVFLASNAIAETPRTQLEGTMERVMDVARNFRSQGDFENNRERLKQIILPRFDFTEMASRSLGSHWSGLNGREKKEFVAAFLQFAEASYMNQIGSYRGEKMTYGREQVDRNFAEVETQVIGRGQVAPITYKLHLVGKEWKVYDVVIDQISLVSNFRSQFGRILKTGSMDELMRRLREKGTQS
jgi:phospholipid transport system substrate-binding protein